MKTFKKVITALLTSVLTLSMAQPFVVNVYASQQQQQRNETKVIQELNQKFTTNQLHDTNAEIVDYQMVSTVGENGVISRLSYNKKSNTAYVTVAYRVLDKEASDVYEVDMQNVVKRTYPIKLTNTKTKEIIWLYQDGTLRSQGIQTRDAVALGGGFAFGGGIALGPILAGAFIGLGALWLWQTVTAPSPAEPARQHRAYVDDVLHQDLTIVRSGRPLMPTASVPNVSKPSVTRPIAPSRPVVSTPSHPLTFPKLASDGSLMIGSGMTLYSIARYYGTTVSALKMLNHLTSDTIYVGRRLQVKPKPVVAVASAPVATPTPSQTKVSHTVVRGDTLYNLARRYGTTVNTLKRLNRLTSDLIRIGQVLTLPNVATPAVATPKPTTKEQIITVKCGDTLYGIARTYGTTVGDLKRWNNLTSDMIKVGQNIRVLTFATADDSASSEDADDENFRREKKLEEMTPRELVTFYRVFGRIGIIAKGNKDGYIVTDYNGFLHIKYQDTNMLLRVDNKDSGLGVPHMHVYNRAGQSLSIDGRIVPEKHPDAHLIL